MPLFEVKGIDRKIYETELRDFLPPKIIDVHTHVWLEKLTMPRPKDEVRREVVWPDLVARDNIIEDLQ